MLTTPLFESSKALRKYHKGMVGGFISHGLSHLARSIQWPTNTLNTINSTTYIQQQGLAWNSIYRNLKAFEQRVFLSGNSFSFFYWFEFWCSSNYFLPVFVALSCYFPCYFTQLRNNSTFINGTKIGLGKSVHLNDGDRISLVLSVAPLVEQYFVYHEGNPRDTDIPKGTWVNGEGEGPTTPAGFS